MSDETLARLRAAEGLEEAAKKARPWVGNDPESEAQMAAVHAVRKALDAALVAWGAAGKEAGR